jgi:hypothetical protein
MALSEMRRQDGVIAKDFPLIFERLPSKIFGPLASQNKEQYWGLLCKLNTDRFGPDAPLPPSHGYPSREIVQDIERFLLEQDTWASEEEDLLETPVGTRAVAVFNRLLEAGWLRTDVHGVAKAVSMRPAVAHFLNQLIAFAESGPVFVSGKINSIDANLKLVIERKASGDTLSEVAQQSRNLLEHIRNTSTIIRDLMEQLNKEATPGAYVSRFFSDYIEQVFIGDYRSLRTHEHPLAKRQKILQMVDELDDSNEDRLRLITWYETNRFSGNRMKAERQYEKDIFRLKELSRIDDYLDRLDDEIRRANKKAITYLDYSLRAVRPVDQLVQAALASVLICSETGLLDPFPAGEMVGPDSLAEPRKTSERTSPSFLRKHTPTPLELARAKVMLRAREARTITPPKLASFVLAQLSGNDSIDNVKMQLSSVADVRSYQALLSLSLAMSMGSIRLKLGTRSMTRGFQVSQTGENEESHLLLTSKAFTVSLTNKTKGRNNG